AGGIAGKPALERGGLDLLMQFLRGTERLAAGAVGDELDRLKQPAAPDVADMTMIAKTLRQPPLEMSSQLFHAVEQVLIADHPLHFERCGAGERMAEIGVAVLERA